MPTFKRFTESNPDVFDIETGKYYNQEALAGAGISDPATVGVLGFNRPDIKTEADFTALSGKDIPQTSLASLKLLKDGATTTGILPDERRGELEEIRKKVQSTDELVSRLMTNAIPTNKESQLQKEIDTLQSSSEAGIEQENERDAPMSLVVGRQERLQNQALLKVGALQRELTRLSGNREAQSKAIETAYNANRNSVTDMMALYNATEPEKLYIDERSGNVYFQNPATGEVYNKPLPGFVPKEGGTLTERNRAIITPALTQARQYMDASRRGEFIDGNEFLKLRNDFVELYGDPGPFDDAFVSLLSPSDRAKYGLGKAAGVKADDSNELGFDDLEG